MTIFLTITFLSSRCLQDQVEAADSCRAGATGRGRELRGRSEDAPDQPVLGLIPSARRGPPPEHGLPLLPSRRGDVITSVVVPAATACVTSLGSCGGASRCRCVTSVCCTSAHARNAQYASTGSVADSTPLKMTDVLNVNVCLILCYDYDRELLFNSITSKFR